MLTFLVARLPVSPVTSADESETELHSVRIRWAAGCLLLLALLWTGVLIDGWRAGQRDDVAAMEALRERAQAQADVLDARFDGLRVSAELLARSLQDSPDTASLQRAFDAVASGWRGSVVYARATGAVVLAAGRAPSVQSLLRPRYFHEAQADPAATLRIYPASERAEASGERLVHLVRRVDAADGAFAGILVLSVPVATLLPRVPEGGSGIERWIGFADGSPLLADAQQALPKIFTTDVDSLPAAGGRVIGDTSIGWQKLAGQALIVTASRSGSPLAAGVRPPWITAMLLSVVLILLAAAGSRWHRRSLQRAAVETSDATRSPSPFAAVEHGMVFVLNPVPIPGSRALNFIVGDCSAAAAELVGRSRETLGGQPFAAAFPSIDAQALDTTLHESLRQGRAELELAAGDGRWWHFSAVCVQQSIVVTVHDISAMKQKETLLRNMALTDALTLLPNRHWLKQNLPDALAAAAAAKSRAGLFFIDLDDFKKINDSFGHQAGDDYLIAVAEALKRSLRTDDVVIRLAGDEFTVLVRELPDAAAAAATGRQIVDCIAAIDCDAVRRGFRPRASVGAAIYPDDADSDLALVQAADIAMYAAKAAGKGRLCMYSAEMAHKIQSRLQLEQGLRDAIERGELFLMFQPRVSARNGTPTCVEALLRWKHPQRGEIKPAEFIALAEQSELIEELGEWVVSEACRQLVQWRERGQSLVPVAINVSARQLKSPRLRLHLANSLAQAQLGTHLFAIELTEAAIASGDPAIREELVQLRRLGIELHIDDFGIGYASLSRLHALDIDAIKSDRSSVRGLGTREEARAVCAGVIQMARSLGLRVVAEGVETAAQLAELQAMRCDEVQGYFIARPMPGDAVPRALSHGTFVNPVYPVVQRIVTTRAANR